MLSIAQLDDENVFFVTAEDLDEESIFPDGKISSNKELKQLLEEWKFLFEGLGHTNVVKHVIQTAENAMPICVPDRRFPIGLMKEAQKSIDEMLQLGVITPSTSEWAF